MNNAIIRKMYSILLISVFAGMSIPVGAQATPPSQRDTHQTQNRQTSDRSSSRSNSSPQRQEEPSQHVPTPAQRTQRDNQPQQYQRSNQEQSPTRRDSQPIQRDTWQSHPIDTYIPPNTTQQNPPRQQSHNTTPQQTNHQSNWPSHQSNQTSQPTSNRANWPSHQSSHQWNNQPSHQPSHQSNQSNWPSHQSEHQRNNQSNWWHQGNHQSNWSSHNGQHGTWDNYGHSNHYWNRYHQNYRSGWGYEYYPVFQIFINLSWPTQASYQNVTVDNIYNNGEIVQLQDGRYLTVSRYDVVAADMWSTPFNAELDSNDVLTNMNNGSYVRVSTGLSCTTANVEHVYDSGGVLGIRGNTYMRVLSPGMGIVRYWHTPFRGLVCNDNGFINTNTNERVMLKY